MRANGEGATIPTVTHSEAWRERLNTPNYQIGEAARYARTSASNVARWHKDPDLKLPVKEIGAELSYIQLIEVAVVARCRDAGMTMRRIREARDYLERTLGVANPFATLRFKTDGKELFFDLAQTNEGQFIGNLVNTNFGGQLAWNDILGEALEEFDYDGDSDLAVRWRVGGAGSPILIDPRVAFGAPNLRGVPTWVFKERWVGKEPIEDTASDFGLDVEDVRQALEFEHIDLTSVRENREPTDLLL
jgi:uncharacterized protein (DUF433 family)